jgi:hypothetical protein
MLKKLRNTILQDNVVENKDGNIFMIGDVVKGVEESAYLKTLGVMKIKSFRKSSTRPDCICAVMENGFEFGYAVDFLQHHIEEFVLPEKWCIKQNISKEVCKWFNKKGYTISAHIGGIWKYLCYNSKLELQSHFKSQIPVGYKEITLEQFKKICIK